MYRSNRACKKMYIWKTSRRTRIVLAVFILNFIVSIIIYFTCFKNISKFYQSSSKLHNPIDTYNISDLWYPFTLQQEELDFPLAFSMLVYTDFDRAERLLRAIYRPHNHYCIHVDRKSPEVDFYSLQDFARQLGSNVYFVNDSQRLEVKWGHMSTLEADLLCSQLLLNKSSFWFYWINLTGQEFPLRTNWELVQALKALNGSNLVSSTFQHRYESRLPPNTQMKINFTWYKGNTHVGLRREFVEYMNTSPLALQILNELRRYENYSSKPIVADETFFATLNHNPSVFKIPGSFLGAHEDYVFREPMRAKVWIVDRDICKGDHWRRGVCIFGLKDLPFLMKHAHFFANKFLPTVESDAYDILEKWLISKMIYESHFGACDPTFNVTYYSTLELAWNHL